MLQQVESILAKDNNLLPNNSSKWLTRCRISSIVNHRSTSRRSPCSAFKWLILRVIFSGQLGRIFWSISLARKPAKHKIRYIQFYKEFIFFSFLVVSRGWPIFKLSCGFFLILWGFRMGRAHLSKNTVSELWGIKNPARGETFRITV